ncbi:MAG: hypothetical protein RR086_05925 [Clostridia bacterium]
MIGKFADKEQLYSAYCELEKEFTKKCQQLKELQTSGTSVKTPPQTDSVEKFFSAYPEARAYETSIVKSVSDNPKKYEEANGLALAYLDTICDKDFKKTLAQDQDFLQQYIFANPKVTDYVLQNVVDTLTATHAPNLISRNNGAMSLALPNKPKTIKEASILANEYFK